jgi:hypothetical protein
VIWILTKNYFFLIFFLAYALVVRPLLTRFRLKRIWEQTPTAHKGYMEFGFDERGLHKKDDEGNPLTSHWDRFLKYRESSDLFLFYMSPVLYLFIPKRFMTPEQQDTLRVLAREHVGRKVVNA